VFEWDIGWWWCCLNPREREVLRATIEGLALTLYVGIPVAVWDAFWLIHPDNGQAVRDAFLIIYRLRIDTILVGEPPVPVDVVLTDEVITYASWLLFLATTGALCGDGCQQSVLP
jgi:hypothetical protein